MKKTNRLALMTAGGVLALGLIAWGVIVAIQFYRFNQEATKFNRYFMSIDYSRKALAANPNDDYAYEGIANYEIGQHQYDAAAQDFRKAWQLNPGNHRAGGELAATLIGEHKYAEAAQVQEVMATYHDSWGDAARKGLASYARYRNKHPNGP